MLRMRSLQLNDSAIWWQQKECLSFVFYYPDPCEHKNLKYNMTRQSDKDRIWIQSRYPWPSQNEAKGKLSEEKQISEEPSVQGKVNSGILIMLDETNNAILGTLLHFF